MGHRVTAWALLALCLNLPAVAQAQVPDQLPDLGGLPVTRAADAAEQAWGRQVARAAGLPVRRIEQFEQRESNGGASRLLLRGVHLELPGLVVARVRFPDARAALSHADHQAGEVRGRQAVTVRGAKAKDGALLARVVAAAWQGLGPVPPKDAPRPTREAPPPPIVVIAVDARSLEALGAWGPAWRAHHAELLLRLDAAGARGVAFAMDFRERVRHEAETVAFASAARASKAPVVMSVTAKFDDRLEVTLGENAEVLRESIDEGSVEGWNGAQPGAAPPGLAGAVSGRAAGGAALRPGEHFFDCEVAHLRPLVEMLAIRTGDLRPGDLKRSGAIEQLQVGAYRDESGRSSPAMRPGLRSGVGDPATIRTLSYVDVLQGRADAAALRGALVLVGADDGESDLHDVPGRGRVAGVFLHAFALKRALAAAHAAWRAGRLRQDDPSEMDELLAAIEAETSR